MSSLPSLSSHVLHVLPVLPVHVLPALPVHVLPVIPFLHVLHPGDGSSGGRVGREERPGAVEEARLGLQDLRGQQALALRQPSPPLHPVNEENEENEEEEEFLKNWFLDQNRRQLQL